MRFDAEAPSRSCLALGVSIQDESQERAPSPPISLVYVTCGSREEALGLARILVLEKWAACGNLWEGVTSIYEWKGEAREERETILLLKTRASLVPALIERVVQLHSYECPCVVSVPLEQGNPAFLEWVKAQTNRPLE